MTGVNSVSASRITINDNFTTLENVINNMLSMIDITTGTFDNSAYASENNVITSKIKITTGNATIDNGNVIISNGDINLNGIAPKIDFGSNLRIDTISVGFTGGAPGSKPLINLSALLNGGVRLPNVATGTTGYDAYAIGSTLSGLLCFDSTNSKLVFWTGSAWETVTSV